ncbi:hypothetical protein PV327_004916 [Microctonus hyperodae]|uniref:Glycosyltransferase family 92 protein n=1 Tax=Microctonus hyperodae TaxID=165561 RepID=A0AA39KN37_MICHY|nr:hypothetical protein PV327_004916 [Microctonus hyperodae]
MLQTCSNRGSRCIRRALIFICIWCLIMVAVMQYHRAENEVYSSQHDPLTIDGNYITIGGWDRATNQTHLSLLSKQDPLVNDSVKGYSSQEPSSWKVLKNEQVLVDKRGGSRTEEELIEEISNRAPNLPIASWFKINGVKVSGTVDPKKTIFGCVPRYPNIFELEYNNIYWQTIRTSNGTFQLFGAYYDNRKLSRIGPAIRIVGMIDRIEPTVKTYCQLWYDDEKVPQIVDILEYKYIWHSKWGNYKQGIYQPYVIACKIPQSHWKKSPPASVSIVEKPCNTASNNLQVIYNKPDKKKEFAVCVKGLDFLYDDLSVRLIEWIELLGILGADKIFFYNLQVHPNVTKVLNHYRELNRIDVTPLTLPGGQPNIPGLQHIYLTKKTNNKRQNELIPYNDCLYKHMYEYEYIALLDIDEVIMPIRDATWSELMRRVLPKALRIRNETRASYNVRNVYFLDDLLHSHGFFDDVPRYMHMLQHVYRSKNFTKPNQYIKCFHNPERIVTLHNHFPLACLGAGCTSYPIEIEDAQLQHYRVDCVKSLKKTCVQYRENSVMDKTIWRYKDELVNRVINTLNKLGFYNLT